MSQMLTAAANVSAHVPVRVVSRSRPWRGTHGEVMTAANQLAGGLCRRGVATGDVIVVCLPNWAEAIIAYWASILLGAVTVPVTHHYRALELTHILKETGARVLITSDGIENGAVLEQMQPDIESSAELLIVGLVSNNRRGHLPNKQVLFQHLSGEPLDTPAVVDSSSVALIAYTSGSTAKPKGVIHTHQTLSFELRQLNAILDDYHKSAPLVVGTPIGHMNGMLGLMGSAIRGQAVTLLDGWDPATALRTLLEERACWIGGPTYFLTSLMDDPSLTAEHLELLRPGLIGLGGSSVQVAVCERAASLGLRVGRSYGLTEHPTLTGPTVVDSEFTRHLTDGSCYPSCEVRIVDAHGGDVATGETGEILSRGADLCLGYTDARLNLQAFDQDGWFATGDIGRLTADGLLTVVDRKKDIIIRGGENISASEVEEILLLMPGVKDAVVVGAPDARFGEHACAFVRLTADAHTPNLGDVQLHLSHVGLAKQKWPEDLRIVEEFPRTTSGKIQKEMLRRMLIDERVSRG
jgi:acyl-CoA synthetase